MGFNIVDMFQSTAVILFDDQYTYSIFDNWEPLQVSPVHSCHDPSGLS